MYVYICICKCICMCMYTYTCESVSVSIYIYIIIYIHVSYYITMHYITSHYIRTHTHIYIYIWYIYIYIILYIYISILFTHISCKHKLTCIEISLYCRLWAMKRHKTSPFSPDPWNINVYPATGLPSEGSGWWTRWVTWVAWERTGDGFSHTMRLHEQRWD